jgi:hypothetical protein
MMKELAAVLIMVFCTPVGWIGMLTFGYMIKLIRGNK